MFLLCIYIILTRTTRKGSHRNKIGIMAICIQKKKKVKIREPHTQAESGKLHHVIAPCPIRMSRGGGGE